MMNSHYYLKLAENHLKDSRYYLDTGEAINWVSDSIRSSIYALMEAWLIAKGYQKEYSYPELSSLFSEKSSKELRSIIFSVLGKASYLEYAFYGGQELDEIMISMPEWMQKAYVCLEAAEKVMVMLNNEIEENANRQTT